MSIFLNSVKRPVNLSMMFFELLENKIEDGNTPDDLITVISSSLTESGACEKVTDAHLAYVANRLEEIKKKAEEEENNKDSKKLPESGTKQFAQEAMKWLSSLEPQQLCLFIATYNYSKAKCLYCEVDRDDVLYMGKQKVEYEFEQMRSNLEASLFGFGGGYGEDKGSNENTTVIDLSDGDTTGLNQFFGRAH